MKTKLFTGLVLAAVLLMGGPAFAQSGGLARGGNGRAISGGGMAAARGGMVFAGRSFRSTPTVAFGGSSRFAFGSHQGWTPGRQYLWNGHNYRWSGNGWFIVDSYPNYGYGYYDPGYSGGVSASVQVQEALAQQGYYHGPINGVVGAGTQAAIAAYQQDNGLRVTGTINGGLLDSLGLD